MQTNAEFKTRFAALVKRAGDKADLVTRKVAIQLASTMILRSPVDSGRFRANWYGGTAPGRGAIDVVDQSGQGAIDEVTSNMGDWNAGQTIFITNSLPYAYRLEYGWSQQAPQGMVRLTIAEFASHVKQAVQDTPP